MTSDTIDFSALEAPLDKRQVYKQFFWSVRGIGMILFVAFWLAIALYGYALLFNFEKNWQESDISMFILAIAGTAATWFLIGNFSWQLERKKQEMRLPDFARRNRFNYFKKMEKTGLVGRLFLLGDLKRYSENVLAGNYEGRDFMMGTHYFQNKMGNNRYDYGFIAVRLSKQLPQIMLRSRRKGLEFTADFKSKQRLSLEGDFDKHFALYVPEGYEQDALYILTPDLMALLIDHGNLYDVEIFGDAIYFYRRPLQYSRVELEKSFALVEVLGTAAHNRTKRYNDWRRTAGSPLAFLQSRVWQAVLFTVIIIALLVLKSLYRASQ